MAPVMTTSSTDALLMRIGLKDPILTPKIEGEYRIAVTGDVHLGHNRVHVTKIIRWLDIAFSKERLADLDMIVINGDLFDRRLAFDSEEVHLITRWIRRFLRNCMKCKVAVRAIEGTPSHDNKQSRWLELVNDIMQYEVDLKYYEKLSIDELFPGGPTALFVPDEVNHDASITWLQVNELLREKGIDKVDYAFMHGMFTYQEPIRSVVSHNEENYHSIVRSKIVINHYHTHSTSGIIIAPGSPERLRHNEEEEKGHYQFSFTKEGLLSEYFIVNEDATLFTTFDVQGKTYPEVVKLLEAQAGAPAGSNFRLTLSRQDDAYASLRELKNKFPQYNLATKVVEADVYTPDSTDDLIDRPTITAIRPDTIADLLSPKLRDASFEVAAAATRILAEC